MGADRTTMLERIAARSWPAGEVERLGGWLLRATDGVTRRANSVLPCDDPGIDVDDAVQHVIEFYTSRRLAPRFQMTHASRPQGLDTVLEQHGFHIGLRVAVETAPMDRLAQEPEFPVSTDDTPLDQWVEAYRLGGGYDEFSLRVRREIMARIPTPHVFASVRCDGEVASVGIGVVQDGWAGIFGVVTRKEFRRRGLATALSHGIAQWARRHGAQGAYLQVEVNNSPARALYHRLGFVPEYEYWYRYLPTHDDPVGQYDAKAIHQ